MVGQRCVVQPEELRSEDQNHMRKPRRTLMRASHSGDGRRGNALIAFKIKKSRQRRHPGGSLLRILNIVLNLAMVSLALRGHCEHMVGDGEWHGSNFPALVAMQPRFDPVLQDLTFTVNAGSNREGSEREYR